MTTKPETRCSHCGNTIYRGADRLEGSAGTKDNGAVYHPDCYFEIVEQQNADNDPNG